MARKKIDTVEVIEEIPGEEVPEIEPPKETVEELREKIRKAQEEGDTMEEESEEEVEEQAEEPTPTEEPKVLFVPRAVSNADMFNNITDKLDLIQLKLEEILRLAKED